MLSDADRKKAAQSLLQALRDRQPIVQLSKTYPEITIEDAYAIQSLVNEAKVAAGANGAPRDRRLASRAPLRCPHTSRPVRTRV